jgi:hypothetical protein
MEVAIREAASGHIRRAITAIEATKPDRSRGFLRLVGLEDNRLIEFDSESFLVHAHLVALLWFWPRTPADISAITVQVPLSSG